MELLLERSVLTDKQTVGKLYINGSFFCSTLEDTVRDINKNGIFDAGEVKIKGHTAIPYGKYEITLNVVSPKFSKYPFYMEVCKGRLPRLLNVPAFEGILIHCADGPDGHRLVQGCIGIGKYNDSIKGLTDGKNTFKKLYAELSKVKPNEKIYINIV